MTALPNIGTRIRRLREAADMSRQELADRLGSTYQTISNLENGASGVSLDRALELARIFGVTVEELAG